MLDVLQPCRSLPFDAIEMGLGATRRNKICCELQRKWAFESKRYFCSAQVLCLACATAFAIVPVRAASVRTRRVRMRFFRTMLMAAGVLATVAAAPVSAQQIRIGLSAEPTAMDPHFHNLTPNNGSLSHIFERLVETDPKNKLIPGLAESWKTIDDNTWEIKLRKNVKWHDGTPFTADDVIFTFERAPNVPNSPASFASAVKGKTIKKIDDHTIHISTAAPHPLMPNDMSSLLIVSKKHGEGAKTEDYNSGKAAIGTGPYRFASFVPG